MSLSPSLRLDSASSLAATALYRLYEADGEPVGVLLGPPVLSGKLPQVMVELVEYRERIVEILSLCRQYLLPVRGVDGQDALRPPLDHPHPELGPLDLVVLAQKVERAFGIGVQYRRDDESPELLLRLISRQASALIRRQASSMVNVNRAPANSPVPVLSQVTL